MTAQIFCHCSPGWVGEVACSRKKANSRPPNSVPKHTAGRVEASQPKLTAVNTQVGFSISIPSARPLKLSDQHKGQNPSKVGQIMQIRRSMEKPSFYRYASILLSLTQLHFLPRASRSGSATQENVHVPRELLTSGQVGTPQRGAWSSRWDYKSN